MKALKAIRCKGYSFNMHAFANLEIQIRKLCYIRRYKKFVKMVGQMIGKLNGLFFQFRAHRRNVRKVGQGMSTK